MKTIAKNRTKKIEEIFTQATICHVYTLDNCFIGDNCEPRYALEALRKFNFAKLRDMGDGTYHVDVHSNRWYELS